MKNNRLLILGIALLSLTACDKHDFFDDVPGFRSYGPPPQAAHEYAAVILQLQSENQGFLFACHDEPPI